jgi:fumarate reductase subunit C
MPPLLRRQPKRYAAPPIPVPWWEPLVAYLLVLVGAITCALAFFFSISLMGCENEPYACPDLTQSVLDGTVGAVRTGVQVLLGLALLAAIAVGFLAGRLHFALVWLLAAFTVVVGVVGIGWSTGAMVTPWGQI